MEKITKTWYIFIDKDLVCVCEVGHWKYLHMLNRNWCFTSQNIHVIDIFLHSKTKQPALPVFLRYGGCQWKYDQTWNMLRSLSQKLKNWFQMCVEDELLFNFAQTASKERRCLPVFLHKTINCCLIHSAAVKCRNPSKHEAKFFFFPSDFCGSSDLYS